jgi:hypothetical protein
MFNSWDFGAYLLWAQGPEHKVFLDGRSEIYEPGGILSDYMYISRIEPGTLDVLNLYHIQYCLLSRDEPLATLLSGSPEWHRVYFDDVSAIFVRNPPTVDSAGGEAQPTTFLFSDSESAVFEFSYVTETPKPNRRYVYNRRHRASDIIRT